MLCWIIIIVEGQLIEDSDLYCCHSVKYQIVRETRICNSIGIISEYLFYTLRVVEAYR